MYIYVYSNPPFSCSQPSAVRVEEPRLRGSIFGKSWRLPKNATNDGVRNQRSGGDRKMWVNGLLMGFHGGLMGSNGIFHRIYPLVN